MSKPLNLVLAFLTVAFILGLSVEADARTTMPPDSTVKGTVFDPGGAVIPGVEIIFENNVTRRTVVSNEDGEYEVGLIPGIYRIRTAQGIFYALRRAAFRVEPNSTTVINISPTQRVLSIGLQVTSAGVREPMNLSHVPKYDAISFSSTAPLDLVVEFDHKRIQNGMTKYGYAKLTYNSLSIHADRLSLDRNHHRIWAKGNVVVDNAGQQTRTQSVSVTFARASPVILFK
jgi:hypothetical protein